jgi:hypothetical protein
MVVLPAPHNETEYNHPIHIHNKDVYHETDPNSANPFNKHSASDLNESFIGKDFLLRQAAASQHGDIYDQLNMSLVAYQSWSILYNYSENRWVQKSGNGGRGDVRHNATNSARTWSTGQAYFPDQPNWTMV